MKIRVSLDLQVNRLVRYFIIVDLLLLAGWGFIEPLFSLYIINKIPGATIATVGVAVAIYWLLKSFLQLPVASYLDQRSSESTSFRVLVAAILVAALCAFLFAMVDAIWQLYLVQMVRAVAFAFYIPAWSGIFSHHLDLDRMSFDWSLDSTAVGISTGVSGLCGAFIAYWFGYEAIFVLAGLFSMLTAIVLVAVPNLVLPPESSDPDLSQKNKRISHIDR